MLRASTRVNPKGYLHNGQWVDAEVRDETIKVRSQRDYHLTVMVTRHGPVISHDGDRILALQWTVLGAACSASSLPDDRPGEQLAGVHRRPPRLHGADAEFCLCGCGRQHRVLCRGTCSIRKQGNGTVPVPGSTDDYDWTGFIPFDDLPHSYNPASGIIATANGRIVPDNYPYLITAKVGCAVPHRPNISSSSGRESPSLLPTCCGFRRTS